MEDQSLKTFIESKRHVLKKCRFHDSRLVIDGSNLYYTLYFKCHLDQAYRGDYDKLENELNQFFTNLQKFNITPYVVIDGGNDYSYKIDTHRSTTEDKIKMAHDISQGLPGWVIPLLSKNVFKQYLQKNNVPFVQCVKEADLEAVALANKWKCPILSKNIYFYIFNIIGGFLPLTKFQWKTVVSEHQEKFIWAKWYNVKNLCSVYNNMNMDLLPISAAILGNSYTKLDKPNQFPDWRTFSTGREEHKNIDGLFTWLSRFKCPEEAIRGLANFMENKVDSDDVSEKLTASIKEYRLTSSSIAQFFESGSPPSNLPCPLQKMPAWMLQRLMKGELNSIIIDVLVQNRLILNFMVEDFKLRSSNRTSRRIRKVIYGLVLGGQPAPSASDTEKYVVEEYDRKGLELEKCNVEVPRHFPSDLHPEKLHKAPLELRLQTLLDTLKVSQTEEVLQVPAHLQLPLYITCYWVNKSKPRPEKKIIWALLVGLVYGDISKEHMPGAEARPVLNKLGNLRTDENKGKLYLKVAHAYSQWQCCVRDSLCLNQLLCNPVPEPHCAWLYNGTLVHSVVHRLQRLPDPEFLLAGDQDMLNRFRKLRRAVEVEIQTRPRRRDTTEEGLSRELEHLNIGEEEKELRGQEPGRTNEEEEKDKVTNSIPTQHKTKRKVRPGRKHRHKRKV